MAEFTFSENGGLLREEDEGGKILQFPYDMKKIVNPFDSGSHFHINHLKRLFSDMARPNLFKVMLFPPATLMTEYTANTQIMSLAKAASFPQISIKEYTYVRAGQRLHIPTNDVDFGELTITFYNDIEFKMRTLLNKWQKLCLYNWDTLEGTEVKEATSGKVIVFQYDGAFNPVYAVQFTNAFPQTLSAIDLNQETENSIEDFTVDFKFSKQILYKEYKRNTN